MDFYQDLVYSKLFWVTTALFSVYLYLKYKIYNVWARRGIPHDKPSIPLGNVPLSYFTGDVPHGEIIKDSYEKYKNHRYHGIYILNEPILVINDLDLIRLILVKKFANFLNRGTYYNESTDPLSCALPRLVDGKWKRLRTKLSPTFTSGKLKMMYPLLKEICDELVRTLDAALLKSDVIEIKDIASRFTIDCISSIAFGFNCNSLRNPEHEFRKYGKIVNDFGKVFVLLSFYAPDLIDYYSFVPKKRQKVRAFFVDLFEKMVSHRRREKVARNDFLDMLMQLMDRGNVDDDDDDDDSSTTVSDADGISMTEAVAQSVIFFAAGQETTSSAICCCLYELSLNRDVQEKLQQEIDQAFASSDGLTYEKIFEMNYLDMVLCETLRKHPGAPVLNRISLEDFDVPEFRIPKATRLVIPVNGIHSDPNVYPDPDRFDPSRFTSENRAERHPFAYLPFGEGPRHCIGKRLGVLKPKIALCHLLRKFSFSVCENKTQRKISYMNNSFVQVPSGRVYLRAERRDS